MKMCLRCKTEKDLSCFGIHSKSPDGLQVYCKDCKREIVFERDILTPEITHKICNECKIDKPVSEFKRRVGLGDGYGYRCKPCELKVIRDKITNKTHKEKFCSKCKTVKPISEFSKSTHRIDGVQTHCSICRSAHKKMVKSQVEKRYRENNSDKIKRYREENAERIKERRKNYNEEHKFHNQNYSCMRNYGISVLQKNEMLEKQNMKCLCCGGLLNGLIGNDVCVDHCHTTNKIRGILCRPCNIAIGVIKENVDWSLKITAYIEAHCKKD